jgi:hypothetical protein
MGLNVRKARGGGCHIGALHGWVCWLRFKRMGGQDGSQRSDCFGVGMCRTEPESHAVWDAYVAQDKLEKATVLQWGANAQLCGVCNGSVLLDGRKRLRWPVHIWMYHMFCQWLRVVLLVVFVTMLTLSQSRIYTRSTTSRRPGLRALRGVGGNCAALADRGHSCAICRPGLSAFHGVPCSRMAPCEARMLARFPQAGHQADACPCWLRGKLPLATAEQEPLAPSRSHTSGHGTRPPVITCLRMLCGGGCRLIGMKTVL